MVLTIWLPVSVENMDVHWPVQSADQDGFVGTCGLVGPVDGFGLPISPINVILKECQGKDMGNILAQDWKRRERQKTKSH